jgi:hypothetical protein
MKKQRTLDDTAFLRDESERPTFRPPALRRRAPTAGDAAEGRASGERVPGARQLESEVRIKEIEHGSVLESIRALLERFEGRDFIGALALADRVLDASRVPDLLVPRELLEAFPLDHRTRALLAHVDGIEPLELVLERSGLPLLDAMQLVCELVERRILTLR